MKARSITSLIEEKIDAKQLYQVAEYYRSTNTPSAMMVLELFGIPEETALFGFAYMAIQELQEKMEFYVNRKDETK